MVDASPSQGMVAFLGVPADKRLLEEDRFNLPEAEQYQASAISTHKHDRLVAAGSAATGITLVGGAALTLYGGWQLLFNGGGAFNAVLAVIGILLVGTHWGWVHVAEYVGLTIDGHQQRVIDTREHDWLASIQPYPRFSVSTSVLDDASTRVTRVLHQPALTEQHTFTFVRTTYAEETFDADTPAEVIAASVETMRRQARLETDRLSGLWEAASGAYQAALFNAHDEQQELAAQRAAATALSEHINASLLEPPLVE
jgi:hypothetical protein